MWRLLNLPTQQIAMHYMHAERHMGGSLVYAGSWAQSLLPSQITCANNWGNHLLRGVHPNQIVATATVGLFGTESQITDANVLLVSQITMGQRDDPAWHLARRGRLTANNFGSLLHAKIVTPLLLKRLLGEYDLPRVKAVQWGANNEAKQLKHLPI